MTPAHDWPDYQLANAVRHANQAAELAEADAMAVETQDAADTETGGILELRHQYPVLFEQEVVMQTGLPAFDGKVRLGLVESDTAVVLDRPDTYPTIRAASTSSLADGAGEGSGATTPAPPVAEDEVFISHTQGDRDGLGAARGTLFVLFVVLPAIYGYYCFLVPLLRPNF